MIQHHLGVMLLAMLGIIIGLALSLLSLWGLVLLFKTKALIAIILLTSWLISAFFLYRNFSYGTQAALGTDPTSLIGRILVLLLIAITVITPLFLMAFIAFYYLKLK